MSKILLIEDDSLFVKMYQKKLTHEGFQLEAALDGEDGVKKAMSVNPDLIILDLMLPKMAGSEVLKKIKEDPKTASIPVIVLTNLSTNEEEVDRCVELGVKETLLKTEVTPDHVVELIRRHLK